MCMCIRCFNDFPKITQRFSNDLPTAFQWFPNDFNLFPNDFPMVFQRLSNDPRRKNPKVGGDLSLPRATRQPLPTNRREAACEIEFRPDAARIFLHKGSWLRPNDVSIDVPMIFKRFGNMSGFRFVTGAAKQQRSSNGFALRRTCGWNCLALVGFFIFQ